MLHIYFNRDVDYFTLHLHFSLLIVYDFSVTQSVFCVNSMLWFIYNVLRHSDISVSQSDQHLSENWSRVTLAL